MTALALFVMVVIFAIVVAFSFNQKPKKPLEIENPTTYGNAEYASLEELQQAGFVKEVGIPLGVWWIDPPIEGRAFYNIHYDGNRHLITIAPTRSGKGTTAQIPALLEYDASLLMIDPKGENAAITAQCRRDTLGHDVYIVNPFGVVQDHLSAHGFTKSARFNPLAALDPESDTFTADVSALCEALIISEGKDPHWANSARDLVAARIMWVCKFGTPEQRTLPAVRDFLTLPDDLFPQQIKKMMECGDIPISNKAARFAKPRTELDNIISTAQTQTAFLDDPALRVSLSGDDFRFLDLKRRKMSVFLVLPAKLIPAYSRWFRLLVVSALDSLMSTEEKGEKPVLLMLDEFASLGHLSSVENAMGLAAGFGVQLWPFVQDVHQLKAIYSERWESFLANAGIQQYFTPNDITTAKHISERAGQKTTFAKGTSYNEISREQSNRGFTGENVSYSETGRPLLDPLELFGMSSEKQILFHNGMKNTIIITRWDYWIHGKYKGRFCENPYFKKRVADSTPAPEAVEPAALVGGG